MNDPRNRAKLAAVGILLVALVTVQAAFLDREPDTREEMRAASIESLPAGDMLATYVASLFLGPFRVVLIDIIWMELRKAEEQRRVYRIKELLDWLTILQPRNQEVRALNAWNVGFNIAMTVNEDDRWEWERAGLMTIRKAVADLPNSPYLKWELAEVHLYKKAMPIDGQLRMDYISNLMKDKELQALLRRTPGETPQSPFTLAIDWMEEARRQIEEEYDHVFQTQMGRNYLDYHAEGFIRDFHYLEAMRLRAERDVDGARERLDLAAEYAQGMLDRHWKGKNDPGKFIVRHIEFYEALGRVVPIEEGPARNVLAAYEDLLRRFGNHDLRFIFYPTTILKQRISDDPNEYNDRQMDATGLDLNGPPATATIFPPDDMDVYDFPFRSPGGPEEFTPTRAQLILETPSPVVEYTVRILALQPGQPPQEVLVSTLKGERGVIPIEIPTPRLLVVIVTANVEEGTDPAMTQYQIRLTGE